MELLSMWLWVSPASIYRLCAKILPTSRELDRDRVPCQCHKQCQCFGECQHHRDNIKECRDVRRSVKGVCTSGACFSVGWRPWCRGYWWGKQDVRPETYLPYPITEYCFIFTLNDNASYCIFEEHLYHAVQKKQSEAEEQVYIDCLRSKLFQIFLF